ncbi:Cyclin, N-terminal, partial [Dillenia turbinata]
VFRYSGLGCYEVGVVEDLIFINKPIEGTTPDLINYGAYKFRFHPNVSAFGEKNGIGCLPPLHDFIMRMPAVRVTFTYCYKFNLFGGKFIFMAGLLAGDPSHHGMHESGSYKVSQDKPEDSGGRWYLSRKEIEEQSPSKQDGIDLKKETYLRKSYCTFLQDLGMRLKVVTNVSTCRPQVTIATAIIFCHRFFLRQSHAKNDRRTIATVCMFLAGKVEETPRPLKDVILVSYEIIHKKDPAAVQRIKQKVIFHLDLHFTSCTPFSIVILYLHLSLTSMIAM